MTVHESVGGDTAHGAPDALTAPIKIGGKGVDTTPTDVDAGDRVNAWFSRKGQLHALIDNTSSIPVAVDEPVTVDGSVTATISGTPNVSVTNTPSVTISGTPNVSAALTGAPLLAADVSPPTMGEIRVLAITTAASAQQDLTEFLGRYVTIISNVDWYLTCGPSGGVTDPNETATTGDGRTALLPWKTPVCFLVTAARSRFKVKGSESGYVRWWASSNA